MRVDHYTATLDDADGSEVLAWVLEALPVECGLGPDGSVKRYAYHHAVPLVHDRNVLAVVRWGGNNDTVSIELKGAIAHETYGLVRAHWPDHACSRMDVAVDGTAPGLYERVLSSMLALRDEMPANRRPKLHQEGDWITPDGRTLYVGNGKNGCCVVLYEKGFEREHRTGENPDPNWTRLEVRVTPQRREHKRMLARLTPAEAWGWSAWAASYLAAFTGLEPDTVELPRRAHSDDRAYAAFLRQYGGLLERLSGGDWVSMGETIGRDLEALRDRRSGRIAA